MHFYIPQEKGGGKEWAVVTRASSRSKEYIYSSLHSATFTCVCQKGFVFQLISLNRQKRKQATLWNDSKFLNVHHFSLIVVIIGH